MIFGLNINTLLGFQSLVQTIAVTPPFHNTAGEFINYQNFAVTNKIIHVFGKHYIGAESLINMINELNIFYII